MFQACSNAMNYFWRWLEKIKVFFNLWSEIQVWFWPSQTGPKFQATKALPEKCVNGIRTLFRQRLWGKKKFFFEFRPLNYIDRSAKWWSQRICVRTREWVGMCWSIAMLKKVICAKHGFLVRIISTKTNRIKLIKLFLTLKFDFVKEYHFSLKIDLTSLRNERLN